MASHISSYIENAEISPGESLATTPFKQGSIAAAKEHWEQSKNTFLYGTGDLNLFAKIGRDGDTFLTKRQDNTATLALAKDKPSFTFDYTTKSPAEDNYIGIYAIDGLLPPAYGARSLKYEYAKLGQGQVQLSPAGIPAGKYKAVFFTGKYQRLGVPVEFDYVGQKSTLVFQPNQPSITFDYTTSNPAEDNYVGIYTPGEAIPPELHARSVVYAYAKLANGRVTLPSNGVKAGKYKAVLLSGTYERLAGPVEIDYTGPKSTLVFQKDMPALAFDYTTSNPDANNYIGIYAIDKPTPPAGGAKSLVWTYASASQGQVTLSPLRTTEHEGLQAGKKYKALLLSGSYQLLAGPVEFDYAPAKETPTEPAKEAPKEPTKEAPKEPTKEAPKEPTKEAPKEPAKEAPKAAYLSIVKGKPDVTFEYFVTNPDDKNIVSVLLASKVDKTQENYYGDFYVAAPGASGTVTLPLFIKPDPDGPFNDPKAKRLMPGVKYAAQVRNPIMNYPASPLVYFTYTPTFAFSLDKGSINPLNFQLEVSTIFQYCIAIFNPAFPTMAITGTDATSSGNVTVYPNEYFTFGKYEARLYYGSCPSRVRNPTNPYSIDFDRDRPVYTPGWMINSMSPPVQTLQFNWPPEGKSLATLKLSANQATLTFEYSLQLAFPGTVLVCNGKSGFSFTTRLTQPQCEGGVCRLRQDRRDPTSGVATVKISPNLASLAANIMDCSVLFTPLKRIPDSVQFEDAPKQVISDKIYVQKLGDVWVTAHKPA